MEFEEKKPCPKIDIDGVISKGKQFDLDITLPEDHRNVIYGVVRNCFKEPVCDAVVKLVEVVYDCGKEERRPVGHTFTDKEGEFVFGPLCPDKQYALQIWVNDTKKIKRTNEAQIAYHFPYMPAIWATLVTEDKQYFVDAYKDTPQIPKSAAWGLFLRVHDELTLEMVNPDVRKIVYDELVKKGLEFRKGFGISGRLANFLDKNPNHIEVAYSILFSLPGIPIIYYGDEIGVTNNFENAKESALIRSKNKIANLLSVFDSRDINRGKVSAKLFYGSSQGYYKFNSQVYCKVHNLIKVRKSLPVMVDGEFELLPTKSKSNFAYLRKNKNQQILVINNLSKEKLYADVTLPIDIILKNNGNITKLKNLINGDNIKVNISLKNKMMHLRLAPYQTLWLDVTPN